MNRTASQLLISVLAVVSAGCFETPAENSVSASSSTSDTTSTGTSSASTSATSTSGSTSPTTQGATSGTTGGTGTSTTTTGHSGAGGSSGTTGSNYPATSSSLPNPQLGNAGFDPPVYLTGSAVVQVAIGDLDGDGMLDIVAGAGDLSGGTATIYYGQEDGGFEQGVVYTTAPDGWVVALCDVDGDGHVDLVVGSGDFNTNTIQVFRNLGQRQLTPEPPTPAGPGAYPNQLLCADLNGDGFGDLLDAQLDEGLTVFEGSSAGLGAPRPIASSQSGDAVLADLNGDGHLDVVQAIYQGIQVVDGVGDGTFGAATLFAAGPGPEDLAVADFNGDGRLDLATTNGGGGTSMITVLLALPDGGFGEPVVTAAGSFPINLAAADFNGDGIPDLLVASDNLDLLLGRGDGTFFLAATMDPVGGPLLLADLNRDGKLDLVTGAYVDGVRIEYGH